MKQARWFIHPIFVFALSTVTLAISLFLYIYWYVGVSAALNSVIRRYQLDANQFFEAKTWVVILILSLLVGVILVGILIIFIYNLKTLQLYRLQHSFIGNFTHELKTPVTSLRLYLETFQNHELPREEQIKYIGFMLQDVERLTAHINSILNLARIESNLYEGEFISVDLVDTVRRFIAGNRHLFRDCDIQLNHAEDVPVPCPVILPLFEILLMNLLTNGVKYNTAEHPRIDIAFDPEPQRVRIRFRDNGIGLASAEKKRIFRKFYQGRGHELMPAAGSGIGLYLAQQIAKLHRGRITAESGGEGLGSEFTVILPRPPQVESP